MISADDFKLINDSFFSKTGITIPDTNINAVKRFVYKQLSVKKSLKQYSAELRNNNQKFSEFVHVATIGETYFFREQKIFRLLENVILPKYKKKQFSPPLIWSAAASTGEEVISIALLINKFWPLKSIPTKCLIATDIDKLSTDRLLTNCYPKSSLRTDGAPFHYLVHDKSKELDGKIIIDDDIVQAIEIKENNLIMDDLTGLLDANVDVIFLCNVLIYMQKEVRDLIINKVVSVLDSGGYLIVSSSNTVFIEHPLLTLEQYENCFYFKKKEG